MEATLNNKELNKFKRNYNFFQFLTKTIDEFDGFEELKGITFGDKNANMKITLILKPDCENSQEAFEEAYQLFQNYNETVCFNILFNINPNGNNNIYKIVAENLIALNELDPNKAKEAILDWYINQLSLVSWIRKWTVETPSLLVHKQLQDQHYWCLKNEFDNLPVKLINEDIFPEGYEIKDLKYFIKDFEEEFEIEETLKAV